MGELPDATSPTSIVASNTRAMRRARGWTLQQLSDVLPDPMSIKTLSLLENNGRGISVDELVSLAAAFNVSVTELLTADEESELEELIARWRLLRTTTIGLRNDIEAAEASANKVLAHRDSIRALLAEISVSERAALEDVQQVLAEVSDSVPDALAKFDGIDPDVRVELIEALGADILRERVRKAER